MAANWPKLPALDSPDELNKPLPKGWRLDQIENLYEQLPIGKRFDQKSSRAQGRVPVIDQSEAGVVGWHDEQPGVMASETRPVVTFANHTCEMRWMREPFSVIQNVFPLIGRTGVCDTRFLYYGTKGRVYLEEYKGHFPDYRRKWIPVPPLAEQRAIAHILGTLDDKIELNRRMAATLEEMARAIFKSWFIDFDPVRAKAEGRPTNLPADIDALFPDSFEDSELGPIPRGWRIGSIAELATVGGGSTPSTKNPAFWDGEFAWATPKDLSKLAHPVLLETERSITEAGLKSISSGLYTPGTVLMSSRAPIGYLAITEIPVAVNQGFIALQPSVECGNLYLLRWLEFNMDAIHGRANGSTFMEISKSAFRSIETVLPSNETIGAFGKVIAPLHRRLVAATRESGALASVRDTLLPKLISGDLSPEGKSIQFLSNG